ncbi:MAG: hypothetical protein Kow00109_05640 [Acidobacteriota bacterium]
MNHRSPSDALGNSTALATLGGGCFWCLEAVFQEVPGVLEVVPGYAGGTTKNPTYRQVCSGATGHAEVVQLRFDPGVLDYRSLLEIFFLIHDPTTPNRQGADVGTQYRSIILYHDDRQRTEAEALIAELERDAYGPGKIVTELAPFQSFYPAEPEHWNYYRRNPDVPYCQIVVAPKLEKYRLFRRARQASGRPAGSSG